MLKNIGPAILIFCLTALSAGAAFAADGASNEDLLRARELSKSVNAFAFDLYKEIAKEEKGSIFFSPLSISMALALAYEGATGETREEMKKVLHYNDNIGTRFKAYIEMVNKVPKESGKLYVANGIWADWSVTLLSNYVIKIKRDYGSEVKKLDFRKRAHAASVINKWIEDKTRGKIKGIVDERSEMSWAMSIINAVYFQAFWMEPFPEINTRKKTFYCTPTMTEQVDMMYSQKTISYSETDDFQAISLPYKNWRYSMVVVLPREHQKLGKLENNISDIEFRKILASFKEYRVNVYLPKFRTEKAYPLKKQLMKLGLKQAFKRGANFNYIGTASNGGLYIDEVLHKSVIETTETHTKATAVTEVRLGVVLSPGKTTDIKEFRADHPFLYLIIDNVARTILFIGRYVDN
ncbi:serpin family protein [Cloacibacillus porcorum]|uniref:serpin family protein n=1 Tax=Cloacibacillus porcorum TaxID=1197717 RepID=UPI003F0A959B